MVDDDITRHNGLTAVISRVLHAFFTKALYGLAEYVDGFRAGITLSLFFNVFFYFAGYYEYVRHFDLPVGPSKDGSWPVKVVLNQIKRVLHIPFKLNLLRMNQHFVNFCG